MNARWTHPVLLLAAVGLTFLNAFRGDFQFDDYNVIVDNRVVHAWTAWWDDLPHGIRPLLKASYTLNWTSGLGLFGFHLFNLMVHAGNVLLVYALSRTFLQGRSGVPSELAARAAVLIALLFALHPVQTEAVTYISGRSTSLMALCYLASLWTYVRGIETRNSWRLYGLSPLLFLCALAAKEVAVTLPVALVLWECTGTKERVSWTLMLQRQVFHWLLLFVALATLLVHPGYESLLAFGFLQRSLAENLLTQVHGVAYLLSRLVLVQHLNIDPDLPVLTRWTAEVMLEAVALLSLLALGFASLRRRPWLSFGIIWFFLHLLPTNSLVPRLDVANERQLYLAGWGLYLACGAAAMLWWERAGIENRTQPARAAFTVLTFALMVVLMTATIARNDVYRNEVALWEDTTAKAPQKARAFNNLGYAYFLAGRHDEARKAYEAALRLNPRFELAGNNLAALNRRP